MILLELYEDPLPDWPQLRSVGGGLDRAFPNISRVSTREYGHRVGIFRMLEAYRRLGATPTVAIDAMTAESYPWLVEHLNDMGAAWVAHGVSVTRPLGSHLDAETEIDYIESARERLAACGIETDAWLGPEYGESTLTPGLLATAGYRQLLDWCGDEQLVPFRVADGVLTGLPLAADLDDQTTLINRMAEPAAYQQHLTDAIVELARPDGFCSRLLSFCWRPWIVGQPFRSHIVDTVLDTIHRTDRATLATPNEAMTAVPLTTP